VSGCAGTIKVQLGFTVAAFVDICCVNRKYVPAPAMSSKVTSPPISIKGEKRLRRKSDRERCGPKTFDGLGRVNVCISFQIPSYNFPGSRVLRYESTGHAKL
jgi:hypothetical protein